MKFKTEPDGYIKTAISDLQGSWGNLRNTVVTNFGFPSSDKLLFHMDEGMSWESVRDLDKMKNALLLVQNIAAQTDTPDEITQWIEEVMECLDNTFEAIDRGNTK